MAGDGDAFLEVLRRFMPTVLGDGTTVDVLRELCIACVHLLEAAGAGVSLVDPEGDLRFFYASSAAVATAERAQEAAGVGPGVDALTRRRAVVVDDVGDHDRWPDHATALDEVGLRRIVAQPLMIDGTCVGLLAAYHAEPGAWTDRQLGQAEALSEIAALHLARAREDEERRRAIERLDEAIGAGVAIDRAIGWIAAELELAIDDASDRLAAFAHARGVSPRVAAELVLEHGASALEV